MKDHGETGIPSKPRAASNTATLCESVPSSKPSREEQSRNAPPKTVTKNNSDDEEEEEDNAKAFDRKMRQQIMKKVIILNLFLSKINRCGPR